MKQIFFVHPSNWNSIKVKLLKQDTLVYSDTVSLPDYVNDVVDALNLTLMPFSEFDKITDFDDKFICMDENDPTIEISDENDDSSGEDEETVVSVDYDTIFAETWDTIEDYKNIYIEILPENICSTLYYFNRWKQIPKNKALGNLYDYKLLMWKEQIPTLTEAQVNIVARTDETIEIASIFDCDKIKCRISICPDEVDNIADSKYVHIISEGKKLKECYRRFQFNKCLQEKYGDDLTTNAFLGTVNAETCFIGYPTLMFPPANKYFYDRTDNWAGLNDNRSMQEDEILRIADRVTCSSKWLYNNTVDWFENNGREDEIDKIKYIPNGNVIFDYPDNVEKFETKTAIYIGNASNKIDFQILKLLCDLNPTWNFLVYCDNASSLTTVPDNMMVHDFINIEDLFPVICKCHVGLITLKETEWTKGMLPNKTFNYFNARIPVLYTGIPDENFEDYKDVCFNLADKTLEEAGEMTFTDDMFDKYKRSWDDVCKELIDVYSEVEDV